MSTNIYHKNKPLRYSLIGLTILALVLLIYFLIASQFAAAGLATATTIVVFFTIKRVDQICENALEAYLVSQNFSPGEVADRWSINKVKSEKFSEENQRQAQTETQEGEAALGYLSRKLSDRKQQELQQLLDRLFYLNKVQWEMEDRVRTKRSWKAAVDARENNSLRVEVKNQINELFDFRTEKKLYGDEMASTGKSSN